MVATSLLIVTPLCAAGAIVAATQSGLLTAAADLAYVARARGEDVRSGEPTYSTSRDNPKGTPMTKNYSTPEFEDFGTVADLTQTGNSPEGTPSAGDMKGGSVASSGQ